MPRHKTAHRKRLEAHNKEQAKARAAAVAELAEGTTLKANAVQNAKAALRGSSKSK